MFSELVDDRNKFSPDYGSMADSIFHPSSHDLSCYDLESSPYSSNSDDFADAVDYDGMIDLHDDLLLPHYKIYDLERQIERQPYLLSLVSPNDILPVDPSIAFDSLAESFSRTNYGNEIFSTMFSGINEYDDTPDASDTPSSPLPESLEQMCGVSDQFLSDKIINENEISEEVDILDDIMEKDILPFIAQSSSNDSTTMCRKTYHPDYDHCYSKLNEDKDDLWTPMGSPDSSGSSSEEVDVVTVTEELQAPFVPKVQVPFRKRQKRGQKSQKVRKNQNSLSPKTFNAAMKRNMTRITTVRRTYRRKINNSVETTPSNSLPSSAPSSRCSSDVEDAGKRANHNSSERKRREVLRTALQNLRLCVPSVQNNLKAPKVQILNCAKEYISDMKAEQRECALLKKSLRSKKRLLEMKLESLAAELKLS